MHGWPDGEASALQADICEFESRTVYHLWGVGLHGVVASFARRIPVGFNSLTLHHRLFGAVAQLGERQIRNLDVGGSNPPSSTIVRRL